MKHNYKVKTTERGFQIVPFKDYYERECSLQQSSAIDDTERGLNQPGSSFIWLGQEDHRMHLNRQQVDALVIALNTWLATGNLR